MTTPNPPCSGCGGPHPFDTTVPSPTWNRVIRAAGLHDYLCLICIVKAFARAGEGLTAELIGDGLDFVPIEVRIRSVKAVTARDLSEENTGLRARRALVEGQLDAIFALANGLSARLKGTPDMYEANKICHAVWAARAALTPPPPIS